MDFGLTAEQEAYRVAVAGYAADRLAPAYQESDRAGRMRPELIGELAGLGLLGLRVPAEHGGSGASAVTTGVALEELARGDFNACYPVLNAALIADILAGNGSPEQRARWLPPVATGDSVAALCLTEPDHGTDAAAISLAAEPDGDGWRLVGEKTSIMLGTVATHGLVFARTGGPGARGVTAFYTALPGAAASGGAGRVGAGRVGAGSGGVGSGGVGRTALRDLGNRSAGRATLTFDGLPVGPADVVGGEGLGFVQVMRGFDYSRALISLMCLAAAAASLDEAFSHARSRRAFGQPIGRFQGVSFPLVEHATALRAARLLAYEALWRKDAGLDHRVEANMVKSWAPRAAVEAAHRAVLTLGHLGWSEDRPLAQRLRDVIGLEIGDGTAQATMLVVARLLLGRDYAP